MSVFDMRVPADVRAVLEQLDQSRFPHDQLRVGDHYVRVTHPERVFWPASDGFPAYTKRDLLKYLVRMWPLLAPHLKDRPLTLKRYPYGLMGKHFFQKHVEIPLPDFVDRESMFAEQHAASGDNVICNNLATLVWLGQMSDIELHTWYSRTSLEPDAHGLPQTFAGSVEALEASVLNYPDFMVFDLDPYIYSGAEPARAEPELHREGFLKTVDAAFWMKEVLDDLHLPSFVKTSGKTGVHIFVPILRHLNYDLVRSISEQICRFVQRQHPNETTMEWSVEKRTGKVFLDHNQNTRGKTLACAYSPRALPGAPVSMPVRWDELDSVYPAQFRMSNALERLDRVGDPRLGLTAAWEPQDLWREILSAKVDLSIAFGAGS